MRHTRAAFACTAAACLATLTACAQLGAPTGPLKRVRTQDADSILQTATVRDPNQPPRIVLGAAGPGASPRVAALLAPSTAPVTTPAASVVPLAAIPDLPVTPAAATATPRDDAPPAWSELQQTVEGWRRAWEAGDANAYLRYYDTAFHGDAASRAAWERQRRQRLANGRIRVQLDGVQLVSLSRDQAAVSFVQHYTSGKHQDSGTKQLVLQRRGARWQIVQERWSPRA
jgi:hypothetical protein